ncbi:MAG: hypothetical protein WBO10_07860 [Pyrinomonadaceae bacterium]
MAEKMHCPRCGKQFNLSTSFCRDCGLALAGVSEIVTGDPGDTSVKSTQPNPKLLRLGIGLFIFGTVLGLANAALKDFQLWSEVIGKLVFMAFVIAGMSLLGIAFIFPSTKYKKRMSPTASDGHGSLPEYDTARLPEADASTQIDARGFAFPRGEREHKFSEPGSVIENTTRQLKQNSWLDDGSD